MIRGECLMSGRQPLWSMYQLLTVGSVWVAMAGQSGIGCDL